MNKLTFRRWATGALSVAMGLGAAMPALAAIVSTDLPKAGQIGYVSAHEYISKTDVEGVYKVQVSIKGKGPDPVDTRVVAVVDTSPSMNANNDGKYVDSQSQVQNRFDVSDSNEMYWHLENFVIWELQNPTPNTYLQPRLAGSTYSVPFMNWNEWSALPAGDERDIVGVSREVHDDVILFPRPDKSAENIAKTVTPAPSAPYNPAGTTARIDRNATMLGKMLPTATKNWVQRTNGGHTLTPTEMVNATNGDINWPDTHFEADFAGNYSDVMVSKIIRPSEVNSNGGTGTTRLGAAVAGASAAADSFMTEANNPAANRTSFGVVGFASSADAANEQPFIEFFGGADYGYSGADITFSTLLHRAGWATLHAGYPGPSWTDLTTGATHHNMVDDVVDGDLFKHFDDVATNPGNYDPDLESDNTSDELANAGLISYDTNGKAKAALKDAVGSSIYNSTNNNSTKILSGLDEAESILFGPEGGIATGGHTVNDAGQVIGVNNNNKDLRRYVILLSDGEDSPGPTWTTMEKVSKMKENGVEFLVMGIDTQLDAGGYVADKDEVFGGVTAPSIGKRQGNTTLATTGDEIRPDEDAYSQFLAFMAARKAPGTYAPTYADWDAVEVDYFDGNYAHGSTGKNYTHLPASTNMIGDIEDAFDDFVKKIIYFGEDAHVDFQFATNAYELYQMPGTPLFEFTGNVGQSMSHSGSSWVWDHNGGLPVHGINTVTFYVKMNSDLDPNLSYPVFSDSHYECTGPFPRTDGSTMPPQGWPIITVGVEVPKAMVSGSNGISGNGDADDVNGATDPYGQDTWTGADQHQANRESAKDTLNYTGNVLDITPNISGLETGTGLNGRSKVIVKVDNGANMRYQWQVKNESGEWEDIFGATSSQYTLSNKFEAGKDYELRCKITNAAGKITFTESIKVTANAAAKGAGLQSK